MIAQAAFDFAGAGVVVIGAIRGGIGAAALFLASGAAGFMTGACLPVDGGYSVV